MMSLQRLELQDNSLQGPVPDSVNAMTTLTVLRLSHNNLSSTIPTWIGNLSALVYGLLQVHVTQLCPGDLFDSGV